MTAIVPEGTVRARSAPWRALLGKDLFAGLAFLILAVLAAFALFPGLVAPMDPLKQNLLSTNLSPGSVSDTGKHLLGTDSLGRDVFSRIVYGARLSLGVGIAGVALSSLIGIPLGLVAGFRGGKFDTILMRIVDGLLSFPHLVLYIFLSYIMGGGVLNLVLILSVFRWVNYVRITRSITLSYREMAFVKASRMVGCSELRIMFRHVLPNILSPLAVLAALDVAAVVLAESSLSFLGLGVPPPTPSWGQMIAGGRNHLATAPWLVIAPGLAIFVATFSLNVAARWARERIEGVT